MRKLYKLEFDNTIKVNKNLINFLNPEYICLPINDFGFFEEEERILKNRVVLETSDLDFASSISGKLEKLVNILINNKKQDALLIKNDFKEQSIKTKPKNINSLEDFLSLLNKDKLFNKLNNLNVHNIVINGIEDEPYTYTENFVLRKNIDIIYDTLEKLNKLYNSNKNYIALKNTEQENINNYLNSIGSYPGVNIIILENMYLIGKDEFLLNKLNLKKENSIVLKPSEILEINNYIKYGYPKAEKFITLINLNKRKIDVINLKKYTLVTELINLYAPYKDGNIYIKNGLMSGKEIDIKREIVDYTFNSLIVTKKENTINDKCINCGKCISVCPMNINPKKDINKCINCNLCSYFCPSNINIKNGDKHE